MNTLEVSRYESPAPPRTPNRKKHNAFHAVLKRDGYRCVRCGSPDQLTMHHKVKLADGGPTESDNLETLCADCHVYHHQAERKILGALAETERRKGIRSQAPTAAAA